jgi:hypothetical protein
MLALSCATLFIIGFTCLVGGALVLTALVAFDKLFS